MRFRVNPVAPELHVYGYAAPPRAAAGADYLSITISYAKCSAQLWVVVQAVLETLKRNKIDRFAAEPPLHELKALRCQRCEPGWTSLELFFV